MKKLELKHLAPYLPYNLKCWVKDYPLTFGEKPFNGIQILNGIYSDGSCVFHDLIESHQGFKDIKPILRPLSDLTKGIVIGKEKFVPSEIIFEKEHHRHLSKKYFSQVFYNYLSTSHSGTAVTSKIYLNTLTEQNPRWIFEYLIRWHFDVFGLIEEGLAIDIKTIEL